MGLIRGFFDQFKSPKGFLGRIVGFIMSKDIKKSEWTISLLQPEKMNVFRNRFRPGVGIKISDIKHHLTEYNTLSPKT